MMKVKLGSEFFKKFINEKVLYIDKTEYIKELIDDKNEVILLTRPRRFGKSLNMDMVKTFFEISDEDNLSYFKGLKIMEAGEDYLQETGKYPVIHLSIKEIESLDWEQCFVGLKAKISEVYQDYDCIKEKLSPKEKEKFDEILFERGDTKAFELSLGNLIKWIHRYYKEPVMVLIDEYDSPINKGYLCGYDREILNFMRNFFTAGMKSNPYLKKAIITGVTRIALESLFSGLNNFRLYSVLDNTYSQYFGFTEDEVKYTMKACKVNHDLEEIRAWYDGYTMGKTRDIYNPWSIMNVAFDRDALLQSYWINSSSDHILRDQLAKASVENKENFYALVEGKTKTLPIVDDVTYLDLINHTDGLWTFLLYAGYLTAENVTITEKGRKAEFHIPNKEVKMAMERLVATWLKERPGTEVDRMLIAMQTGDYETFEDKLHLFIKRSFSYFDITREEPERVYHAFILGLLAHLDSDWYVSSNPIAGFGRADILMMKKVGDFENIGVILEFKKARKEEQLEPKAVEALEQIKTKDYIAKAKKRGAKKIYGYGIGFYKTQVLIEMAEF